MPLPVDRYLVFFHRLQKRALRFGCRAIDFVGENELRKDRSRLKFKLALVFLKNGNTDDIRRQQVAGELDPLVTQTQDFGE